MRWLGFILALFLISSVHAQSCLEELLFSNEIAEEVVCFHAARLVCLPFTYACGCEASPESIATDLSMSLCHFFCCNPNLTPVCFWRKFAQVTFSSGLDRWERCGLSRRFYDPAYLTACCIPISATFILSTPLFIGYYGLYGCIYCLDQCCDIDCSDNSCSDCINCCSRAGNSLKSPRRRRPNHRELRYSVIYRQEPPFPRVVIQSIQPVPRIARDPSIAQEMPIVPTSSNSAVRCRAQNISIFGEILNEPFFFFLGVLFFVFNYYFLENLERIHRRTSR